VTKPSPRKVCDEAIDRMCNGKQKNAARDCGRRPLAARERKCAAKRRTRDQTASLNDRATCSLIGSTASAIAF
jgi:hypothetical protein